MTPVDEPLTAVDRQQLRVFRMFRDNPPSVGGLFWRNRLGYLALVGWIAGCALVVTALDIPLNPAVWAFVSGLAVGAVARDFGTFRRTVRGWPFIARVTDWQLIDRLAEQADRPDPQ